MTNIKQLEPGAVYFAEAVVLYQSEMITILAVSI